MIINPTDFRGILSVGANLYTEVADTTTSANIDNMQQAIEVYEQEYLQALLGGESLSDLVSFLNGEECNINWDGVLAVLKGSDSQLSPIACYVYFNILHDLAETATQMGVVASADRDSRSPRNKQVRAWNLMIDIHESVLYNQMTIAGLDLPRFGVFRKLSVLGI